MKRLRNAQYLNRYPFLVLTDDLFTGCPLHKYVNDTTLSELVQPKQLDTHILTYLADLLTWAAWGAGTISGQCGQIFVEKIRRKAPKKIAFPTHVVSLPTLDLIKWVGKNPPAIT